MRKIAFKSLTGRRKETRLLAGMLILLYAVNLMLIIFVGSYTKTLEENRFQKYGEWTGAVIHADTYLKSTLATEKGIYNIGAVKAGADVYVEGKECGKIGCIDRTARKLGRIELKAGKWPQTEREIVLPASFIETLDKPVKIGDKVSLSYLGNGQETAAEYMLTGTFKTWGTGWAIRDFSLPSVIQWETADVKDNDVCYLFKASEMNHNNLMDLAAKIDPENKAVFEFNEKAYPEDTSLAFYFLQDGKYIMFMLLISTIIIGYILTIFAKNERYSLLILRGLGAARGQIFLLALWKCVIILGISALAGSIAGFTGGFIVLNIARFVLDIRVVYEVNWPDLLQICSAVSIVFSAGYICMAMQVCTLDIKSSYKEDSELYERKAFSINRAEKLTIVRMVKRSRKFFRERTFFRIGISVLVIIISAVCMELLIKSESDYRFWKDQEGYSYIFNTNDLTEGISDKNIADVKAIPGMEAAEYEKYINVSGMEQMITISWNGWSGSEYVRVHRRYTQVQNSTQPYGKEGDYFILNEIRGVSPQDKERLSSYSEIDAKGEFNEDLFDQGEECILFLSPYQIRDQGGDVIDYEPVYLDEEHMDKTKKVYRYEKDGSILPGDYITVSSPWGKQEIKVGSIIYTSPQYGENVIAVGDRFLDKLCQVPDKNLYNAVKFRYSGDADFNKMDEVTADYFSRINKGEWISNERMIYEEIREQLMSSIFRAVVIAAAVWLLYLLLMYQGNAGRLAHERKKTGILQALGISKLDLRKMYYYEYLYEGIMILIISGCICAVWFAYKLRTIISYDSIESFRYALTYDMSYLRNSCYSILIAFAVFIGINIITLYIPVKRILKNSVITNIRDTQ